MEKILPKWSSSSIGEGRSITGGPARVRGGEWSLYEGVKGKYEGVKGKAELCGKRGEEEGRGRRGGRE